MTRVRRGDSLRTFTSQGHALVCYSAQIWQDYRKYVRAYGAELSIKDFIDVFWRRREEGSGKFKTAKAMGAAFDDPESADQRLVDALVRDIQTSEGSRLEREIFKQRARLADAERELRLKTTKKASENKRIATEKVEQCLQRLTDLRRPQLEDQDSRIFPGYYAPVMVVEEGRRVVKPMRYQCRLPGKPTLHDVKFPGTYNARMDNLEGYWRPLFGVTHGIVVVEAFYENVARHRMEGRALDAGEVEQNVVLEFKPRPVQEMLAACLWSRWSAPGQPDLLSFAAITDEPPPAIAAAGHDRCIVPIKPEHVDAWLNPDPKNLRALYAILRDRERPHYEYCLAA